MRRAIGTPNTNFIIPVGFGKTLIGVEATAHDRKTLPRSLTLVVCKKRARHQWKETYERQIPGIIVHICDLNNPTPQALSKRGDVVLVHFEILHRLEWLKDQNWTRVIVDEVHKIKNPTALRTKAVYALSTERRVGLTATQIHKSAADLFGVLRWLYPKNYRNKRKYYLKYVETEKDWMGHEHIVGTRNISGLAREISPFTMIVNASDEFAGVPKALYIPTEVPMTATQDELYWKVANADDVFVEGTNLTVLNGLSRLSKLQQIGTDPTLVDEDRESSKIEWLQDWVEELQEQAIIFVRWRELAGKLANLFDCPLVASGSPEGSELPFKRGDKKLLVATIDAAAESLDFPDVHTDVFVDCHPSNIIMSQAIGRIDRPGSGVTAVKRHFFLLSSIIDREMYEAFRHNKNEAELLYSAIKSHQTFMSDVSASQKVKVN